MLIGFSVKNFKSIKDECVLSLEASNYYKEHLESLITTDIPGLSGTKVLPVAAIYGPNASGKSTLIDAARLMRNAVLAVPGVDGAPLATYEPFLLDDDSRTKPTELSVEFCVDPTAGTTPQSQDGTDVQTKPSAGVRLIRYLYTFSFSQRGVESEELRAYVTRMPRRLFTRARGKDGAQVIEGSDFFPIPEEVKEVIGSHMLVLSFFAQAGTSKAAAEAKCVAHWFRESFVVVDRSPTAMTTEPLRMRTGEIIDGTLGTDYQRRLIQQMMRRADAGIVEVVVKHIGADGDAFDVQAIPQEVKELLSEKALQQLQAAPMKYLAFMHQGVQGVYELTAESAGTLQLFSLAGHIAQALEGGHTLFVDELDASLHPDLANALVALFLNPETNVHHAQLIFTAHNTSLMSNPSMRRDEFWIMDKSLQGVSTLYPISEFKARKGESIQASYLLGKYAGLPNIPPVLGDTARQAGDDAL